MFSLSSPFFFQKPSFFAVPLPLTLLSFTKKANAHCFHIFCTVLSSPYLPAPTTLCLGWMLISLSLHHSLPSPLSKTNTQSTFDSEQCDYRSSVTFIDHTSFSLSHLYRVNLLVATHLLFSYLIPASFLKVPFLTLLFCSVLVLFYVCPILPRRIQTNFIKLFVYHIMTIAIALMYISIPLCLPSVCLWLCLPCFIKMQLGSLSVYYIE